MAAIVQRIKCLIMKDFCLPIRSRRILLYRKL